MAFRSPSLAQDSREITKFVSFLRERKTASYVEVGTRAGGTFYYVARSLPVGSLVVAIDQPNGPWGNDSSAIMQGVIDELRRIGYNAHVIWGDSSAPETVSQLAQFNVTQFDAILIDADHRYEGVKRDYQTYAPWTPVLAFHDIVGANYRDKRGNLVEVPRLWAEIKNDRQHVELIGKGSKMGIGILYH